MYMIMCRINLRMLINRAQKGINKIILCGRTGEWILFSVSVSVAITHYQGGSLLTWNHTHLLSGSSVSSEVRDQPHQAGKECWQGLCSLLEALGDSHLKFFLSGRCVGLSPHPCSPPAGALATHLLTPGPTDRSTCNGAEILLLSQGLPCIWNTPDNLPILDTGWPVTLTSSSKSLVLSVWMSRVQELGGRDRGEHLYNSKTTSKIQPGGHVTLF